MSTTITPPDDGLDPRANGLVDTSTAMALWEEIARTHLAEIDRHAYRLTGNRADAEDLRQDVLVRAFRALPAGTPSNLDAWLYRITLNLFLDRMRRKRRIAFGLLPDAEELVESKPGPPELVDQRSFDVDVELALEGLTPDCRAAVVMRDIGGLSYEEIASAAGVGRGTVASRIHRGRRQLRSALGHRAPKTAEVGSRAGLVDAERSRDSSS